MVVLGWVGLGREGVGGVMGFVQRPAVVGWKLGAALAMVQGVTVQRTGLGVTRETVWLGIRCWVGMAEEDLGLWVGFSAQKRVSGAVG